MRSRTSSIASVDTPLPTPATPLPPGTGAPHESGRLARAFSSLLSPFFASSPTSTTSERTRSVSVAASGEKGRRTNIVNWNGWRSVVSLNTLERDKERERDDSASVNVQTDKWDTNSTSDWRRQALSPSGEVSIRALRRKVSWRGLKSMTSAASVGLRGAGAGASAGSERARPPLRVAISAPRALPRNPALPSAPLLSPLSPRITLSPPNSHTQATRAAAARPPRIELCDFGFTRDGRATPPPEPEDDDDFVPVLEPPLSVELDFGDLGLEFELYLAADAAVNANNDEETFRRHSVAA